MTATHVLLIIAMVAFAIWTRRSAAKMVADSLPAFTSFFARTGYQYADMLGQPPEQQAARAKRDGERTGEASSGYHYVREVHGVRIDHRAVFGFRTNADGQRVHAMSIRWEATLPFPLRMGLQIADKSLDSSLRRLATDVLLNTQRTWSPQFAERVETGIPAIDQRFVVYSNDARAAQALFYANPGIVPLLDGWAELDVVIDRGSVYFADPTFKNMNAAMGGTIGNMAIGFDMAKRLELTIPVHDRIAELLITLSRACA